jgi:hypothetical protein
MSYGDGDGDADARQEHPNARFRRRERSIYKTGFRNSLVLPTNGANLQDVGKWEMPPCMWDEGAPTVAVSVSVALGIKDGQRIAEEQAQDITAAFLLVKWGSGKACQDVCTAEFDLIDGVSFPLVAHDATFYVVYPANGNVNVPQPGLDVSVSVGLAPIGSGACRAARRTREIGDLQQPGFVSAPFTIPNFATGAIYASSDGTATAVLTQLTAPIAGAATRSIATMGKQEFQSVPVIQGARGATLTTPAASLGNKVIFLLSPA